MKTAIPGMMVALACSLFIGRMEAGTPSPTPTPIPIAPPIPAPQLALHDQLAGTLSQAARTWVAEEAAKAATDAKITESNIRADVQTRFTGQSMAEADKNILLFIVLTDATKKMGDDLVQKFVDLLKKPKPATASAQDNPPGTITLPPEEWLPLQAAMQRRAQFMTTMTGLMKKISDVQGSVVGKLQ
jgi:hypothetical protein